MEGRPAAEDVGRIDCEPEEEAVLGEGPGRRGREVVVQGGRKSAREPVGDSEAVESADRAEVDEGQPPTAELSRGSSQ